MKVRCQSHSHLLSGFWRICVIFVLTLGLFGLRSNLAEATDVRTAQSKKTYLEWDDVKCVDPNSSDCYPQTYCNIYRKTSDNTKLNDTASCADFRNEFRGFHAKVNGYSSVYLVREKPSTVIISIHGLWGNDAQFARTIGSLSHIVSSADHNAIGLTLPGHKKEFFDESYLDLIKKNTPFATHDQWLVALQHTLRVARQLGQKTIIVGQSTGGLLAVYAALKHSELVDQIVLIEPALQVRSLMNFGSCLSASIPEEVIKGLGLLIGVPVPDGVSIKMGCEVQKVADLLFPRRFEHRGRGPRAEVRYIEDFSTYTKVAAQVRVPVLMINNENDRIVSTEANRNFFAGLTTGKQYISINKDGKMPHGRVTSAQPETLANQLIEFTYHHLRESTLGNIYLYRVGQRLRSHRYALCATWDSLQTCLENYRTRAAAADRFTAELRTIIQNEAEFERVLSVIDFLDTFWLRQIHQGLQNGKKILNDVHEEVQKTRPDGIEKLREAEIFLEDVTKNFTKDI